MEKNNSKKSDKIFYLKKLKYILIKDTYALVQMILKNQINEETIYSIEVNN